MIAIGVGILLLCSFLGFLTGASGSPVAGTLMGALVGALVAAIPVVQATLNAKSKETLRLFTRGELAAVLIVAGIGLWIGTIGGMTLRWSFWATAREGVEPRGDTPPKTVDSDEDPVDPYTPFEPVAGYAGDELAEIEGPPVTVFHVVPETIMVVDDEGNVIGAKRKPEDESDASPPTPKDEAP